MPFHRIGENHPDPWSMKYPLPWSAPVWKNLRVPINGVLQNIRTNGVAQEKRDIGLHRHENVFRFIHKRMPVRIVARIVNDGHVKRVRNVRGIQRTCCFIARNRVARVARPTVPRRSYKRCLLLFTMSGPGQLALVAQRGQTFRCFKCKEALPTLAV